MNKRNTFGTMLPGSAGRIGLALLAAFCFAPQLSAGGSNWGWRVCYLLSPSSEREAKTVQPENATGTGLTASVHRYVVDRLLDLADIFTIEFSAGELDAEVRLTRYGVLGAGIGCPGVIGWSHPRAGGLFEQGVWHADLLFLTAGKIVKRAVWGTPVCVNLKEAGVADMKVRQVSKCEDIWAVGVKIAVFFGVKFQIHPVEIADFFTGLVGIDLENDDMQRRIE